MPQTIISIPIFDADMDAEPTYECPGITKFNINPGVAGARSGLPDEEFAAAVVKSVKVSFNEESVQEVRDLPFVTAIGLFMK